MWVSIHLSIYISIYIFIYLYIYLSFYLSYSYAQPDQNEVDPRQNDEDAAVTADAGEEAVTESAAAAAVDAEEEAKENNEIRCVNKVMQVWDR